MGAETKIWVKVAKTCEEWIEVSAVTRVEAEQKARCYRGVVYVLESQYEEPSGEENT